MRSQFSKIATIGAIILPSLFGAVKKSHAQDTWNNTRERLSFSGEIKGGISQFYIVRYDLPDHHGLQTFDGNLKTFGTSVSAEYCLSRPDVPMKAFAFGQIEALAGQGESKHGSNASVSYFDFSIGLKQKIDIGEGASLNLGQYYRRGIKTLKVNAIYPEHSSHDGNLSMQNALFTNNGGVLAFEAGGHDEGETAAIKAILTVPAENIEKNRARGLAFLIRADFNINSLSKKVQTGQSRLKNLRLFVEFTLESISPEMRTIELSNNNNMDPMTIKAASAYMQSAHAGIRVEL